jgi:radical SAM superfamily enzyme YgiQ (UPF0313 family)
MPSNVRIANIDILDLLRQIPEPLKSLERVIIDFPHLLWKGHLWKDQYKLPLFNLIRAMRFPDDPLSQVISLLKPGGQLLVRTESENVEAAVRQTILNTTGIESHSVYDFRHLGWPDSETSRKFANIKTYVIECKLSAQASSPAEVKKKGEVSVFITSPYHGGAVEDTPLSEEKKGISGRVYASSGIVRSLTRQGLQGLSRLKLVVQPYQSSSGFSFGQTTTAPIKERIVVKIKAVLQDNVAFRKASEINSAITNAWNRFIKAFAIKRLRLSVQNIFNIGQILTQSIISVKPDFGRGLIVETAASSPVGNFVLSNPSYNSSPIGILFIINYPFGQDRWDPGLHIRIGTLTSPLRDKEFMLRFSQRLNKEGLVLKDASDWPDFDFRVLNLAEMPKGMSTQRYIQQYIEGQRDFNPIIAGLSALSEEKKLVIEVGQALRMFIPEALRIVGGPLPSIEPVWVIKNTDFQVACIGEGVETLCEIALIRMFSKTPSDLSGVTGIACQGEDRPHPLRTFLFELSDYPFAAQSLDIFYPDINIPSVNQKREIGILTELGCPKNCSYCCQRAIYQHRVRLRSADSIIEEIKYLMRLGFRWFVFVRENAAVGRARLERLVDMINEGNLDIIYTMGVDANDVDEELIFKMAHPETRRGLVFMEVALESGDPAVLKAADKDLDLEHLKKITQFANRLGVGVHWYVLVGLPKQSWQSVYRTALFLDEVRLLPWGWFARNEDHTVVIAIPYPGTRLATDGIVRIVGSEYEGWLPSRIPATQLIDGRLVGENHTETEVMLPEEIFEARVLLHDFYWFTLQSLRRAFKDEARKHYSDYANRAFCALEHRVIRDLIVCVQEGLTADLRRRAYQEILGRDGDKQTRILEYTQGYPGRWPLLESFLSQIRFTNGYAAMRELTVENRVKWMRLNALAWSARSRSYSKVSFRDNNAAFGQALDRHLSSIRGSLHEAIIDSNDIVRQGNEIHFLGIRFIQDANTNAIIVDSILYPASSPAVQHKASASPAFSPAETSDKYFGGSSPISPFLPRPAIDTKAQQVASELFRLLQGTNYNKPTKTLWVLADKVARDDRRFERSKKREQAELARRQAQVGVRPQAHIIPRGVSERTMAPAEQRASEGRRRAVRALEHLASLSPQDLQLLREHVAEESQLDEDTQSLLIELLTVAFLNVAQEQDLQRLGMTQPERGYIQRVKEANTSSVSGSGGPFFSCLDIDFVFPHFTSDIQTKMMRHFYAKLEGEWFAVAVSTSKVSRYPVDQATRDEIHNIFKAGKSCGLSEGSIIRTAGLSENTINYLLNPITPLAVSRSKRKPEELVGLLQGALEKLQRIPGPEKQAYVRRRINVLRRKIPEEDVRNIIHIKGKTLHDFLDNGTPLNAGLLEACKSRISRYLKHQRDLRTHAGTQVRLRRTPRTASSPLVPLGTAALSPDSRCSSPANSRIAEGIERIKVAFGQLCEQRNPRPAINFSTIAAAADMSRVTFWHYRK